MTETTNTRSHGAFAALALALPWLIACGTSHRESSAVPESTQPESVRFESIQSRPSPSAEPAERAVTTPEPATARLQTATFALG